MRSAYPLLLDLTARRVVVIGGGAVAARKVRGLLEAGAGHIRCVAPSFADEMPEGIERVCARYEAQQLAGAALVFAATDDQAVNAAVVRDAHAQNLLVNRADSDDAEPGDFATPAMVRDGDFLVAVSAGGNPALAAAARDAIAATLSPQWANMTAAMQTIRPRVLASGWPIEQRRRAFRDLVGAEAMSVLAAEGIEGLWQWLQARHGHVE